MDAMLVMVIFDLISVNYGCPGWKPKPGEEFNSQCQETRIERKLNRFYTQPVQNKVVCERIASDIIKLMNDKDRPTRGTEVKVTCYDGSQ